MGTNFSVEFKRPDNKWHRSVLWFGSVASASEWAMKVAAGAPNDLYGTWRVVNLAGDAIVGGVFGSTNLDLVRAK